MNKTFIPAVVMAIALLTTSSCKEDLLDKAPYGVQTDDSFFKTTDDLNKTLTAAYSYLNTSGFPDATFLWKHVA